MKMILSLLFCLIALPVNAAIIMGNPKGDIALTEIFDYQCPHCRQMSAVVDALIQHHDNLRVRLMPVALMNSLSVIQAAYATSQALDHQDFLKTHQAFMSNDFSSRELLKNYIRENADTAIVWESVSRSDVKKMIHEGYRYMNALHVTEVPIFIIQPSSHDKKPIVLIGEQSYEELNNLISRGRL